MRLCLLNTCIYQFIWFYIYLYFVNIYNGPSTQALICFLFGPYHSQNLIYLSFVCLFVLWLNTSESWILKKLTNTFKRLLKIRTSNKEGFWKFSGRDPWNRGHLQKEIWQINEGRESTPVRDGKKSEGKPRHVLVKLLSYRDNEIFRGSLEDEKFFHRRWPHEERPGGEKTNIGKKFRYCMKMELNWGSSPENGGSP